jgi:hypothetical protein
MASIVTNNDKKPSNSKKPPYTSGNKYGKLSKNPVAVAKRASTLRLNSTSSLFVDSTLAQPNNQTTIRSVAEVIQKMVVHSDEESPFDEPTSSSCPTRIPTVGETEYVIRHVFKTGQLSVDCNIIALVYLERLLSRDVKITPISWRPLLCVCLMLASKIWDDLSMINEDFSTFLPFSLDQINKWEIAFLNKLSFNVRVKASEYARKYFELRQHQQSTSGGTGGSGGSGGNKSSTSSSGETKRVQEQTPLDMESAHRLEALSVSAQSRFEVLYGTVPDSSGSVHNMQKKGNPIPIRMSRSISDSSNVSGGKVKSTTRAILS